MSAPWSKKRKVGDCGWVGEGWLEQEEEGGVCGGGGGGGRLEE